jgi:hypothetical protein
MTPGGRLRSPVALRRLPGRVSYFAGADRTRWVVGAPTFARVVYRDVWPGVDVAFHGRAGTVEFDLDFAPRADPGRVALRFAGARAVREDGRGGAVVALGEGSIQVPAPRAVQGYHRVVSRLVVRGDTIRVALGAYDHARALVVDPTLVYDSDLVGGNAIAVDSAGDAYVTGGTGPPPGPAYVAKLNPTGTALVYSISLGGSGATTGGDGIAVDANGDAYVTGTTGSSDFPTTPGAFQTSYSGCCGNLDAFVTKLNPTGSALVYSTYLGGAGSTYGDGIALDSAGDAYVTGSTGYSYSTQFPTTPGAYQATWRGWGGHGFVTKLNPSGSALVYSTYLGSGDTTGEGIAVDASGDAYITGSTGATDSSTTPGAYFPTTPDAYQTSYSASGDSDGFVTKLSPSGSALVYSTYLGCNDQCYGLFGPDGLGIAVDSAANAYVAGLIFLSPDSGTKGFVTKFSLDADVLWAPRVSPRTFTLTGRRVGGRCVKTTRANHGYSPCTRPIRLSLGYQLSARAHVTFRVARLLPGRLAKGRCVKPAHENQKHQRCTRVLSVRGALTANGQPGSNSFTFHGRIGGHRLDPGRYQLAVTPTVDGQSGAPWTVGFRIAP